MAVLAPDARGVRKEGHIYVLSLEHCSHQSQVVLYFVLSLSPSLSLSLALFKSLFNIGGCSTEFVVIMRVQALLG